ncbi:hypothetical protein DL771_007907 [Monosporascus sp. 5C6A]|nr:hypothetical protein DL771_007907 [Monosporascus sp. 5C6A]
MGVSLMQCRPYQPPQAVKIAPLSSHCTSAVKEQIEGLTRDYGRIRGHGSTFNFTVRSAYVKWMGQGDDHGANLMNLPQPEVECQLELTKRRGHVDKTVIEFVIINSSPVKWDAETY